MFNLQPCCLFWLGLADGVGVQQGFDETLALCITNILPLPAINLVARLAQSSKCISLRLYLRAAIPYPKQDSVRVCQNQGPRDGISRIGPTRLNSKARRLGNRPTVHFSPVCSTASSSRWCSSQLNKRNPYIARSPLIAETYPIPASQRQPTATWTRCNTADQQLASLVTSVKSAIRAQHQQADMSTPPTLFSF